MQLLYLFIVRRSGPAVDEVFAGSVTGRVCMCVRDTERFDNVPDDVVRPSARTHTSIIIIMCRIRCSGQLHLSICV